MSTTKKVMEATARALAEMSGREKFLRCLNKCCRSIKKRAKWVAAHGGRLSTSSLVDKWEGEKEQTEQEGGKF